MGIFSDESFGATEIQLDKKVDKDVDEEVDETIDFDATIIDFDATIIDFDATILRQYYFTHRQITNYMNSIEVKLKHLENLSN